MRELPRQPVEPGTLTQCIRTLGIVNAARMSERERVLLPGCDSTPLCVLSLPARPIPIYVRCPNYGRASANQRVSPTVERCGNVLSFFFSRTVRRRARASVKAFGDRTIEKRHARRSEIVEEDEYVSPLARLDHNGNVAPRSC
ncbi:hypothetical protein K0M31_020480 [Melipona bicolor]|uniref:Uncharacterized protein n=1 Tax=Melipona bicolor TaxID=60889 RepID=A0AA40FCC6_9HYME|nr:hypothetical protein K0M31_020480 [Melipona bicolor]